MSDQDVTIIEPLNNRHRIELGIAVGFGAAIQAMEKKRDTFGKLPGFNSAMAVLTELEARHRCDVSGSNMRAAIRAGFDIQTHYVGMFGAGKLYVKPMDLTELAEFAGEAQP